MNYALVTVFLHHLDLDPRKIVGISPRRQKKGVGWVIVTKQVRVNYALFRMLLIMPIDTLLDLLDIMLCL